jgi:hypothetical protein
MQVSDCMHIMCGHMSTRVGSGQCVGVYGDRVVLRTCNHRSLRQRWALLLEVGHTPLSAAEEAKNEQLARDAHVVCEMGGCGVCLPTTLMSNRAAVVLQRQPTT